MTKRLLSLLLILLLLLGAAQATEYRTLREGDRGSDVLALKRHCQVLSGTRLRKPSRSPCCRHLRAVEALIALPFSSLRGMIWQAMPALVSSSSMTRL